MRIKMFEQFNQNDKLIKTTYQVVSPESAEQGDYADQGWENEEGVSMVPDKWDDDDVTAVDKAVDFLNRKGATEPFSHDSFSIGISYSTIDPDRNYETGEDTYYSCYLYGFTPIEELQIWKQVTGKKLSKKEEKEITQNLINTEIRREGDIYNL